MGKDLVRDLYNIADPIETVPAHDNTILVLAALSGNKEIGSMIESSLCLQADENFGELVFSMAPRGTVSHTFIGTSGRTTLHFICSSSGQHFLGGKLYDRGASRRRRRFARSMGLQMIKIHRTDINRRDLDRRTPLHYAVQGPETFIVKMLLDYGADVNIASNSGVTPLHAAARSRWISAGLAAGRLLLRYGADKSQEILSSGLTARDLLLAQNWEGLSPAERKMKKRFARLLKY